MKLELPELKVRLRLSGLTPLPFSRYAPTIMGPFAYLKKMECVHGVISLHHRMEGVVIANGRALPVAGVGYLEKDRGTSFPQRYLWFQSNQCGVADSCFFLSLASIPLGPLTFNGCLFVVKLRDQLHRFATYTGCRLESLRCRPFADGSGWAKLRFHQGLSLIHIYAGFIEEDGAGKYTGYGVELLERISRITGWRYEYVYGDWQQILSQLDEGSIDLIMTAQYTEERADQFLFSQQPIGDELAVVYAREDASVYYDDSAAMDGLRIGLCLLYTS